LQHHDHSQGIIGFFRTIGSVIDDKQDFHSLFSFDMLALF
jgi:hypothetical protein